MDSEGLLREIQEIQENVPEEDLERIRREIVKEAGINEDLHLLLLGRPGVGKSTFAGEITGGKIKGSFGPTGGTKSSDEPGQWRHIKTEKVEVANPNGSGTKKVYFVHDTVGLGVTVDLDEMKKEANEVREQRGHCSPILCLGWRDRMDSRDTDIAFDLCDSLGMWGKVIVVIMQCDTISQDSDSNSEESIGIKAMEFQWKQCIKEKLESMNVEGSEIERITDNIIFYPKEEKNPVDQSFSTWAIALIRRLKDILQFEDNIAAAINYAILLGTTIINFHFHKSDSLKSSDNDQVQICTEPNQNTDGSFSQKRQQLQSGNEKSPQKKDRAGQGIGTGSGGAIKQVKWKKDTKKEATIAGGITGGILGGIGGGIAGVIGGKAIGGAVAIAAGATIGGAVGGVIVGGVIFALLVYFLH